MRKALFLVNISLDSIRKKRWGNCDLILERDENGFFDHVFTVHFPTARNQVAKLNDRHTVIEFSWGLRWLQKILSVCRFIIAVRGLIKRENISIIRAIDAREEAFFAMILSFFSGVPWCVSIHSDYEKRRQLAGVHILLGSRRFTAALERFVLRRAPMILAIRNSLADRAVALGAKKDAVRVIPHGLDTRLFTGLDNGCFKERFGINNGEKVVSFVGRMSRENYVYDILQIAMEIRKLRKDASFLLAGTGKEDDSLKSKIYIDGIENIRLMGQLTHEDAVRLRISSHICLCLMGGYSLLEAAAAGKPLIAYDVEWHDEVVINGKTGFLVRENDIEGAVDAIVRLLQNPAMAKELGENARRLAFERYSLSASSRQKIKCYEELLSKYRHA